MQIVNIAGCRSLPVRFTDGGFPSCVNEHIVSLEKLKQLTVLIIDRAEIWPVFDAGFSFVSFFAQFKSHREHFSSGPFSQHGVFHSGAWPDSLCVSLSDFLPSSSAKLEVASVENRPDAALSGTEQRATLGRLCNALHSVWWNKERISAPASELWGDAVVPDVCCWG